AFLDAAVAAGWPRVDDPNGAERGGFGYQPRTIWRGRRWSAARAFLEPALSRPNLEVMCNTSATRLVFRDRTAVGVEVLRSDGTRQTISTRGEIILCAGALASPSLLQRSGVGPADCLKAAG